MGIKRCPKCGRLMVYNSHFTEYSCPGCGYIEEGYMIRDLNIEPEKHTRWVDKYGGKYDNPLYMCSKCKKSALYKHEMDDCLRVWNTVQELSPYCPHCGVEMYMEG